MIPLGKSVEERDSTLITLVFAIPVRLVELPGDVEYRLARLRRIPYVDVISVKKREGYGDDIVEVSVSAKRADRSFILVEKELLDCVFLECCGCGKPDAGSPFYLCRECQKNAEKKDGMCCGTPTRDGKCRVCGSRL